jgi:hypothetical protein
VSAGPSTGPSAGPSSSPSAAPALSQCCPSSLRVPPLAADLVLGLVAHPLLDRVPDLVLDQVPGWFQSQRCPALLSSAPQFCSSAGPSGALVPDLALALVQLLVPGRVGSSSALALDRVVSWCWRLRRYSQCWT